MGRMLSAASAEGGSPGGEDKPGSEKLPPSALCAHLPLLHSSTLQARKQNHTNHLRWPSEFVARKHHLDVCRARRVGSNRLTIT